ncbi:membrane protein implicated in regulation of membrane protease activity [Frigoribacterium sp. PvP054]
MPGARRAAGAHPTDRRLLVVKPWLKYSIVRLGLFAVVLGVLLVLRFDPLWATLIAAVVGFCVSYLFFAPLRRRVALDLAERRSRPARLDDDSAAEDEAIADDEADTGRNR